MFERLVTVKPALSTVSASIKKLEPFSAAEWEIVEEYVKVLKPFKLLTATMSGSTYPTISLVIPRLNEIKHKLAAESISSTCLPHLRDNLIANIDRRWADYELKPLFAVSTLLDPRYKDAGFENDGAAAGARAHLLDLLMKGKASSESASSTQTLSHDQDNTG